MDKADTWIPDGIEPKRDKADRLYDFGTDTIGCHVSYLGHTDRAVAVCLTCGGNTFNVGAVDYCTFIRCTTCGWEQSVHEG